ncbi:hypothetical protein [Saccharothrix sp. Mg75]|uniref:hypothetical protein n=1 Tax=Saccharothrix sp. Mg75 TaxID=3445357 RepID=UPI003EEEB1C5
MSVPYPRWSGTLPGEPVLKPLALGGTTVWFGPLDVPHAFAFLGDTARAQVVLGDDGRADGKVWHAPAARPLIAGEFAALAGRVIGTARRPTRLPTSAVTAAAWYRSGATTGAAA